MMIITDFQLIAAVFLVGVKINTFFIHKKSIV